MADETWLDSGHPGRRKEGEEAGNGKKGWKGETQVRGEKGGVLEERRGRKQRREEDQLNF